MTLSCTTKNSVGYRTPSSGGLCEINSGELITPNSYVCFSSYLFSQGLSSVFFMATKSMENHLLTTLFLSRSLPVGVYQGGASLSLEGGGVVPRFHGITQTGSAILGPPYFFISFFGGCHNFPTKMTTIKTTFIAYIYTS